MKWSFPLTLRGDRYRVVWPPFVLFVLGVITGPFLPSPWNVIVATGALLLAGCAYAAWFFDLPAWKQRPRGGR